MTHTIVAPIFAATCFDYFKFLRVDLFLMMWTFKHTVGLNPLQKQYHCIRAIKGYIWMMERLVVQRSLLASHIPLLFSAACYPRGYQLSSLGKLIQFTSLKKPKSLSSWVLQVANPSIPRSAPRHHWASPTPSTVLSRTPRLTGSKSEIYMFVSLFLVAKIGKGGCCFLFQNPQPTIQTIPIIFAPSPGCALLNVP